MSFATSCPIGVMLASSEGVRIAHPNRRAGDCRDVCNRGGNPQRRRKNFHLAKEIAMLMMKTSDARRILRTVVATELAQ